MKLKYIVHTNIQFHNLNRTVPDLLREKYDKYCNVRVNELSYQCIPNDESYWHLKKIYTTILKNKIVDFKECAFRLNSTAKKNFLRTHLKDTSSIKGR